MQPTENALDQNAISNLWYEDRNKGNVKSQRLLFGAL
jgi:hypothetical protein